MKQFAAVFLFLCFAHARADTLSPLAARGYTVMPQPQMVRLGASDFPFSRDWRLELQGVAPSDAAVSVRRTAIASAADANKTPGTIEAMTRSNDHSMCPGRLSADMPR